MYGRKIFRKMSHKGRRPKCCPESRSFLQKDTIQCGKQSNWGVGKQHKTSPQSSPEATHKNKREEPWKAGKKTAGIQKRLMTAVAHKTQVTLTRVIWTITQGKWTKTANKTHRNTQRPVITKQNKKMTWWKNNLVMFMQWFYWSSLWSELHVACDIKGCQQPWPNFLEIIAQMCQEWTVFLFHVFNSSIRNKSEVH